MHSDDHQKAESTAEVIEATVDLEGREIGKRIAEFRKDLGITQKELADKLGVTVTTIANWENGRRSLRWLIDALNLCTALKCELNDFVKQKDNYPSYDELIKLYEKGELGKSDPDSDIGT